MVLKILAAAYEYFPKDYTVHVATGLIGVLATYRIAQGRKTTRERDLHARVVVLTGAFTPLGLTLLEQLAKRGAHVIALTPHSVADERVSTFIDLLRSTTSNENIYAEECDLASPPSIQAFAARFVKGTNPGPGPGAGPNLDPPRVDALVFAHEYAAVGAWGAFSAPEAARAAEQLQRDEGALGTFLLMTLLLPALLTAPVERDIRIVNMVNRFYAAAAPRMFKDATYAFEDLYSTKTKAKSTALQASPIPREATRALRTIILTRHLQRVLDALPSAPVPNPLENPADAPPPTHVQKSNIVAVSVSPGLSRAETVAPLFGLPSGSRWGWLFYVLLYPLLLLFAKSSSASIQSVLHVLFLPTPIKVRSLSFPCSSRMIKAKAKTPLDQEPEEALKPGALYAECSVVRLDVAIAAPPSSSASSETSPTPSSETTPTPSEKGNANGKEKAKDELTEIPDDGELGGEAGGRAVWEAYEAGLRVWEAAYPTPATSSAGNPVGNAGAGAGMS
ncbi:hypothetical protein B0H16DRAFT_1777011 [Mycena metata]|uniref:Ketoreductase (KR) domain-containing protein n=1 Tax=Mycena metata TaxID=1033252 RepID=A0AAD7JRF7_9AGAR|nr:hypothetical protein B0H16DRAFT_1777011 [Mycena metata]